MHWVPSAPTLQRCWEWRLESRTGVPSPVAAATGVQRSPGRMVWMEPERCEPSSGSGPPWKAIAGGTPAGEPGERNRTESGGPEEMHFHCWKLQRAEIEVDLGGKLSEWSIIECVGKRTGSAVEPWWIFALRLLYQFHRLYQSLSPFEWLHNSKGSTVLLSDVLHSLYLLVGTIHLIACFCQCYVWEIHLCCV